jgi:hypothetical protein
MTPITAQRTTARDCDLGVFSQKGLGDLETNAAGTAGHKDALSVKPYGRRPYAAGG